MFRKMCARSVAVVAVMVCLWTTVQAQGLEFTVKGELQSRAPRAYSEYLVELVDTSQRTSRARTDVRSDGYFELRNIPPGDYSLVITTLHGDTIQQQSVTVSATTGEVDVRLPDGPPRQTSAKTISARQLLHPPTKKAFNSFVEAQRFSEAGDYAKAAAALEHAVQESPDYAEAHINLGAQYVRTGRFAEAIAELTRAIEIAGPGPQVLCNLASAQARLGRRQEAIESARWALRIDSRNTQSHLILGALLATDSRTRAEAIEHLEVAAGQFESARTILAKLRP